jgi:hypothetical protein
MRYLSLLSIYKCFNAWRHIIEAFSKDRRFRCFVLIAAIEDNSVSQRHHVANVINIFKASVIKSGYSFLLATQMLSNSSDENYSFKVSSADN